MLENGDFAIFYCFTFTPPVGVPQMTAPHFTDQSYSLFSALTNGASGFSIERVRRLLRAQN